MSQILKTAIDSDNIALWWIGQSGFIIKTPDDKITVIDAYLSNSVAFNRPEMDRLTPIPIQPEELVCDYYICTHSHADHADPWTIKKLKNKGNIQFIGPRNVVKCFRQWGIPEQNISLLEAGEQLKLNDITLTATICVPNEESVLDSIGIIFQYRNKSVYHSGDTAYHPFLGYIEKYRMDLAMLCINGKYGNMNYREAYELAGKLNPKSVVPCHFDMFPINLEDPELFVHLFHNNQDMDCILPEIGKVIIV